MAFSQLVWCQTDQGEVGNVVQQSQVSAGLNQGQWGNNTMIQLANNDYDISDKSVKGSSLLWEEFERAEIVIEGGKVINEFDVNYDLDEEVLVLKKNRRIYFLPLKYVSSLGGVFDSTSRNLNGEREYQKKEVDGEVGLYQMIATGKYSLYKHVDIKLKRANYNVALNIGDKRPTIKKIEKYFIFYDNKFYEVHSKRKKALKKLKNVKEVHNYIKKSKVDTNNPKALETMIILLNQKN